MKKLKIDLFKLVIVLALIGFLFMFYQFSENGRYLYAAGGGIIDSRTGIMYSITDNKDGEKVNNALPK